MASHSAKKCPLCHEVYDEEEWCPRRLPCSHTLCTKCIENLISRHSKTCPFCIRGFKARTSQDVGVNTRILDVLKLLRKTKLAVSSSYKGKNKKHSYRVNDLRRETDEVINNLLDSVQEADDEIDRNLQSNEELENSLINANEIVSDLLTENVKRVEYLREQSRRLKGHKISFNETRNILRTAKNKLASAGTFMEMAEVADDVKSTKRDTETHLTNFMVHLAEDKKTRLKLEKVVNLTKDPIEKIVESSAMDDESNLIPDINHLKIRDVNTRETIETLQSRSHSVMELIKQGQIFGVQEFEERKRYAQITLDNRNRICLHYLKEQNIPPKAHLLKHIDILKLLNVKSRLVFLELSEKKLLGRIYIRLSPQTKRADQFALLCSGEKGVSYVHSNLLQICNVGTDYEGVWGGDYENRRGKGGKALVPEACNEEGGILKLPLRAGLIQGWGPGVNRTKASQFIICTKDNPKVELDWCFGMVEEGLSILKQTITSYPDIRQVVISDAGMVLPI